MSDRGRFPRKDADFSTRLSTIVPYLNSEATRLLIASDRISRLNELKTDWDDLFPKSTNPSTSTKTIRDRKNATRKDIETLLRKVYADIPRSRLTTADCNTLNLRKGGIVHTPRGKMDTEPGVIVSARTGRKLDVECRVSGDSTRASRHPQSDAIEWHCKVAGTVHTGIVSKARFTIQLPESDAGEMADVQCRWINLTDSNKNSEWSAAVSVMVMF
jgi:hypothetical protein